MTVPFVDLQTQYQSISGKIQERIHTVLQHGRYIMGPEISELEQQLAEYCRVNHAVACSSGTDALLMALMTQNVGPGDVVFTSPFTFIATAEVIALLGATPVFVDIEPQTFNINPRDLAKAIRAVQENDPSVYPLPGVIQDQSMHCKPKAIIAVDIFGLPADYREIEKLAEKHRLFLIEDAAQSFGAEYHGQKACSFGDIACTSFFPAKPLGCYGDGGAVLVQDENLCRELASIRIHGQGENKYVNRRVGLTARMDSLQAAILLAKLEIFPQELEKRQAVADNYTRLLKALSPEVTPPVVPAGIRSAWAQYSILADSRDELSAYLSEKGVPTSIYYPIPLHLQEVFSRYGYKQGDMPVSEDISKNILSLPMHPYLTKDQAEEIAGHIAKFYNKS